MEQELTQHGNVDELAASAPVAAADGEATHVAPATADEPAESVNTTPSREAELQAEVQRLQGAMQQVEQWAQQQNQQQQIQAEAASFQAREERIKERANLMSREDAERYMADEYRALTEDRVKAEQQRRQQETTQWEQRLRAIAQPQWVDRHIRENGLSDEERKYLASLPPDNVPAVAQFMAAQRKQQAALKDQIEQLSRTQQAGVLQASGLGNLGGTTPAGVAGDLPSDPDERALAIYHQLMGGGRQ